MTTRMLIDARHQEETRVAVLKGNRIEEFDFESADRKQIKGNIYLAKVTRVEPSLQAAFIDFGGNRHGFLAFSEIHPDYYQIPKEDREALLAEEAAHAEEEAALRAEDEADDDFGEDGESGEGTDGFAGDDMGDLGGGVTEIDTSEKDQVATIEGGHVENGFAYSEEDGDEPADSGDAGEDGPTEDGAADGGRDRQGRRRQGGRGRSKEADDLRARRMALRRRYKIQDVIQRRQVLLVQVVKEERGNKGAALTTYLSLAGRYCVLMPNSSHGGGISRKISSAADRKRLKSIVSEMDLPKSMGCIVRTAGLARTKTEIKRDFDYLARLWDEIRENTMKSSAPALIHSDSDLVKRAIRDIYNRDIEEIVVEGEHGYRAAREFMKLLMPSHARRVKAYADPVPLFQRYGAEDQLTAMYDPVVQLKSGGYIVINPTEALVSIDINSGRSTKEHGIEATAVSTNIEAAREIARQLRLRDMAGLVVIDFIDMEFGSNVRKVEKAMKDSLKNDRARLQIGRISSFGLMEMSRQRLRTGVLEATTRTCPHCDGTGLVRTASSAGLSALRLIEEEAAKGKGNLISLYASTEAAIYLLNAKRADLGEIEHRYGVAVEVMPEGENEGAKMRVGSSGPPPEFVPSFEPIVDDFEDEDLPEDDEVEEENDAEAIEAETRGGENDNDGDGDGRKRRKRRRGRGRDRRDDDPQFDGVQTSDDAPVEELAGAEADGEDGEDSEPSEGGSATPVSAEDASDEGQRKRRRRGRRRRGGRGRGDDRDAQAGADGEVEPEGDEGSPEAMTEAPAPTQVADDDTPELAAPAPEPQPVDAARDVITQEALAATVAEEAPAKPKRARRKKADAEPEASAEPVAEEASGKPKRTRRKKADGEAEAEAEPVVEETAPKPKRTRRKKADVEAEPAAAAPADSSGEAEPMPVEPAADVAAEAAAEGDAGVGSDFAAAERGEEAQPEADEGDGQPARRGWWQRTFGT